MAEKACTGFFKCNRIVLHIEGTKDEIGQASIDFGCIVDDPVCKRHGIR
jgi:hypothetical protein